MKTKPPKYHTVLGYVEQDEYSNILRTGYMRFSSPVGLRGLARERGDRLDILAVDAIKPGTGQFRNFIAQAKARYQTICVWVILNQQVKDALTRYGFSPETEIQGDGEVVEGMRWDKPKGVVT